MKTHTPGPWTSELMAGQSGAHEGWRVWGVGGPVGEVYPLTYDGTGGEANVRLVSAAPDLLEAARHAAMEWRLHGQLTDSCRVLEAAIAKAEGAQ